MAEETKYRFTHYHEGRTMLAPEFFATDDGDAVTFVKTMKGDPRDEPFRPCFCGGEKLERFHARESNGNVIQIRSFWTEVKLI